LECFLDERSQEFPGQLGNVLYEVACNIETAPGVTVEKIVADTEAELAVPDHVRPMQL
jgi:hypothetical protein